MTASGSETAPAAWVLSYRRRSRTSTSTPRPASSSACASETEIRRTSLVSSLISPVTVTAQKRFDRLGGRRQGAGRPCPGTFSAMSFIHELSIGVPHEPCLGGVYVEALHLPWRRGARRGPRTHGAARAGGPASHGSCVPAGPPPELRPRDRGRRVRRPVGRGPSRPSRHNRLATRLDRLGRRDRVAAPVRRRPRQR